MDSQLLDVINQRQAAIHTWLAGYEQHEELPLTTSVDIRDAQCKRAVVDTNLFPSGFNNLCEHGIADSVTALRTAIRDRVHGCRNILVIAEAHTRNTWYLEHLRILQSIIEQAGYHTTVATFLEVQPSVGGQLNFVELDTASGQRIRIYSIERVLKDLTAGGVFPCFIILNNDLSAGIPDILQGASVPIYPSIQAGWHSRSKSHHFRLTAELIDEFSEIIGLDPWLFSCLFEVVDQVSIHEPRDRQRLADSAASLIRRIQAKYNEHGITDKPFVFLKADRGTYGMGVMPFEDPQQIVTLGRRARNKLYKTKGAQVVTQYLLQEGVPAAARVQVQVAEAVVYQIANQFVGGFYRSHGQKSDRESLNAAGMEFSRMCPHAHRYGEPVIAKAVKAERSAGPGGGPAFHPDPNIFDVYRILARISGIAAHREIRHLETAVR